MSSSYIKASYTNNKYTGENIFCGFYFWRFVSCFFFLRGFSVFQGREDQIKTRCLPEVNLFFYMKIVWCANVWIYLKYAANLQENTHAEVWFQ